MKKNRRFVRCHWPISLEMSLLSHLVNHFIFSSFQMKLFFNYFNEWTTTEVKLSHRYKKTYFFLKKMDARYIIDFFPFQTNLIENLNTLKSNSNAHHVVSSSIGVFFFLQINWSICKNIITDLSFSCWVLLCWPML